MFWVIAIALIIIAALALVWPARTNFAANQDTDARFEALRAELKDIEHNTSDRYADSAEREAARAEVARRLFALEKEREKASVAVSYNVGRSGLLLMLLPALAVPLYLVIGAPEYSDQRIAERADLQAPANQDFDALIARVEKRLRDSPDDIRGWQVIAPVYVRLGRLEDAFLAYGRIAELSDNARVQSEAMANQGEILISPDDGLVPDEANALFDQAIALDQDNQKALFFKAIYVEQTQDTKEAIATWENLISRFSQSNPNWLSIVENRLQALNGNAASGGQLVEPRFTDEQLDMIEGMVSGLAARLEDRPDDVEGWVNLMRSYTVLNRHEDAQTALQNARQQFPAGSAARQNIEDAAVALSIKVEDAAEKVE